MTGVQTCALPICFPVTIAEQGWRQVSIGESVKYVGDTPSTVTKSLINIVHISDTHICDAQSPARVEYLDRFADPHHPISTQLGS